MKCLLCPKTIDEKQEAKASEEWTPISVIAHRNGGVETLITGYTCPDEKDNLPFITMKV